MKLLINAAGISATGPIQVTISFLQECISFNQHEYHILSSKTLSKEINKINYPDNFNFYEIYHHPMHDGVYDSWKSRRFLKKLEERINPDVVFSVFGPSYWVPKSPHLQGFAQSHHIYPESPFFQILSWKRKIKWSIIRFIHITAFKKCGKYFVCETKDVSERVITLLNVPDSNVFTVTNTCSANFYEHKFIKNNELLPMPSTNEFRLLCLCSYMAHKNLQIINSLVQILKTIIPDYKVLFILTVDEMNYNKNFTEYAKESIINIGRIPVDKCPQLYSECNAIFLPTLLECFSANYPEAMIMKKPILTSDLPFARAICNDAALYFNPLSPKDIAEKIKNIIMNNTLYNELIEKGNKRILFFDTPKKRTEKYLHICQHIVK